MDTMQRSMGHGKPSPKVYIYITDLPFMTQGNIKEEGWKDYESQKPSKPSVKTSKQTITTTKRSSLSQKWLHKQEVKSGKTGRPVDMLTQKEGTLTG